MKKKTTLLMKRRLFFLMLMISALFLLIIFKYYKIQILDRDMYRQKAVKNQVKTYTLAPKRGNIYDRNNSKLAYTVMGYRVTLNKKEFNPKNTEKLAEILEMDEAAIDALIESADKVTTVKRHISRDKSIQIRKESMRGISVTDDPYREYPYNTFASRTLGHTNVDNKGITGIEYTMEKYLKGTPGKLKVTTDRVGNPLPYGENERIDPTDGYDVYLTLDEVIQHFTEKSLQEGIDNTNSDRMMAIVMKVKTGEILAIASNPSYDLNNPRSKPQYMTEEEYQGLSSTQKVTTWNNMWKNPIVSEVMEPGSTFKIVTAALGLEEAVVTLKEIFVENTGFIDVYGQKIKCWIYPGYHGKQTFVQAMENSCNPVFVKVVQRLGEEKMYKGVVNLGFDDTLDIKMPSRANAQILTPEKMGPVELATVSFGQGIAVSPLQLMRSLSGIINNGYLVEPKIISMIKDKQGNIIEDYSGEVEGKKIISDQTSRKIRLTLESVVINGSGKNANISGIRVGGKTGTAQKVIDGKYSEEEVFATFFGFAPVNDPEVAVLVIADNPKDSIHGSTVAAPVAKNILKPTLRYLGIKPNFNTD